MRPLHLLVASGTALVLAACGQSAPMRAVSSSPALSPSASPSAGVIGGSTGDLASTTAPPRWQPRLGLTWQWQLSGRLDTTVAAQVYDVDLVDTGKDAVTRLHGLGRRAVCYLSAGSYESGRPDSAAFPAAVKGRPLDGYPGERWLDVRRTDVLLPIMAKRMDLCRAKGFDAVEPDNVDGYSNPSGFPLTSSQQLRYNRALASLAHARGLAVALKNDLDQVPDLVDAFDFAVNEQCFEYDECSALAPFVRASKPVLHVEYGMAPAAFCAKARALHFSSMLKHVDLDAYRRPC